MSFLPRKLVKFVSSDLSERPVLVYGEGGNIVILNPDDQRSSSSWCFPVFSNETDISGLDASTSSSWIVWGGRCLAVLRIAKQTSIDDSKLSCPYTVDVKLRTRLLDWICSAHLLDNDQISVLCAHNQLTKLRLSDLQPLDSVQCDENCLLYCGALFGRTWDGLICISGTIFSDILIWQPSLSSGVLQRFCGHNGVVFDAVPDWNKRLLFSVGDDRSLRVWRLDPASTASSASTASTTSCSASSFGHEARPWRVLPLYDDFLATIGEDETICFWSYSNDTETLLLHKKLHLNKGSIRSADFDGERMLLVVGTHGGSLMKIQIPDLRSLQTYAHIPFPTGFSLGESASSVLYSSANDSMLCVTSKGRILKIDSNDAQECQIVLEDPSLRYSVVDIIKHESRVWTVIGSLNGDLYFGSSDAEGVLKHYKISNGKIFSLHWLSCSSSDSKLSLLTCTSNGQLELWECAKDLSALNSTAQFQLPAGRQQWTAAADSGPNGALIVGDRNGSIFVFKRSQSSLPVQSFLRIHGKHGVTDVLTAEEQVWTLGRDGYWRRWEWSIHQLVLAREERTELEWPARFIQLPNPNHQSSIYIAGFRANCFALFDCQSQTFLFSVDCGGGHRSWDLYFSPTSPVSRFLFIKEGAVYEAKTAAWSITELKGFLHSRRINAAVYAGKKSIKGRNLHILVTGSDDTTLVVLKCDDASIPAVMQRLRGHISSVHSIACSNDLMCSGGGRSELRVWKWSQEEFRPLAISRDGNNLPGDNDIRYTAVNLFQTVDSRYKIVAARSDGPLKVFYLDTETTPRLILITALSALSVDQSESCMFTNLGVLGNDEMKRRIVASSTSGIVCVWDLTVDILETDNWSENDFDNSNSNLPAPSSIPSSALMEAESCGLSAMDVAEFNDGNACVIVGSESGSISVLLVSTENGRLKCKTSSQLHASTVTGITIMQIFDSTVQFASVSMDQRLCISCVTWTEIPNSSLELSVKQVKIFNCADPAAVVSFPKNQLFVCGAGAQVLNGSL